MWPLIASELVKEINVWNGDTKLLASATIGVNNNADDDGW